MRAWASTACVRVRAIDTPAARPDAAPRWPAGGRARVGLHRRLGASRRGGPATSRAPASGRHSDGMEPAGEMDRVPLRAPGTTTPPTPGRRAIWREVSYSTSRVRARGPARDRGLEGEYPTGCRARMETPMLFCAGGGRYPGGLSARADPLPAAGAPDRLPPGRGVSDFTGGDAAGPERGARLLHEQAELRCRGAARREARCLRAGPAAAAQGADGP